MIGEKLEKWKQHIWEKMTFPVCAGKQGRDRYGSVQDIGYESESMYDKCQKDCSMTMMQEQVIEMIKRMPDEKIYYVVGILKGIEGLNSDSEGYV